MVKIGNQTHPYENVLTEDNVEIVDIELPFDVHYEKLLDLFHEFRTTVEGPWRLSNRLLRFLHAKNGLPGGPSDEDMRPIWQKMVIELCPIELVIPSDFKVEDRIEDVDDNKDIIFATGNGIFLGENVRILRLSNPAVAMLLRLAS